METRRFIEGKRMNESRLQQLGVMASLVYFKLIGVTDDAGMFPADPKWIDANCFLYTDDMDQDSIASALDKLEAGNFIARRGSGEEALGLYDRGWFFETQKQKYFRKFYVEGLGKQLCEVRDDAELVLERFLNAPLEGGDKILISLNTDTDRNTITNTNANNNANENDNDEHGKNDLKTLANRYIRHRENPVQRLSKVLEPLLRDAIDEVGSIHKLRDRIDRYSKHAEQFLGTDTEKFIPTFQNWLKKGSYDKEPRHILFDGNASKRKSKPANQEYLEQDGNPYEDEKVSEIMFGTEEELRAFNEKHPELEGQAFLQSEFYVLGKKGRAEVRRQIRERKAMEEQNNV